ncbi:MAG: glycosyltransferase, partial [Candidatus Aminicenantaceae bacterium]
IQIRWEDPRQIIGDLKDALDALADSSGMRRRMGRAALRNVRENLVWEMQGKMLNSVYSQTLLQEESIRIKRTGKGRFFY